MKLVVLSPHLVILAARTHEESRNLREGVEQLSERLQRAGLTVLVFGGVDEVVQQIDLGSEPTPEQVEDVRKAIETLKGVLRA